jgi:hypothetical protein
MAISRQRSKARGDRLRERSLTTYPFFWFSVLERSIEKRNFRRAIEAQQHLERLGYKITFVEPLAGEVAHAG